jgi:thiol-disulfide isomerase/thioredoxin
VKCGGLATLFLVALAGCNPAPAKGGITADSAPATATAAAAAVAVSPPSGSASASARPVEASRARIVEAVSDTDALSLVRTERLRAKAENRVLVVYVGAVWCPPCRRFKAELASGRLDARLARVTLLAFDADRDVDRLGAAGYTFNFVPFVALPGADGRPSDSVQATGKGEGAWQELLAKLDAWQA